MWCSVRRYSGVGPADGAGVEVLLCRMLRLPRMLGTLVKHGARPACAAGWGVHALPIGRHMAWGRLRVVRRPPMIRRSSNRWHVELPLQRCACWLRCVGPSRPHKRLRLRRRTRLLFCWHRSSVACPWGCAHNSGPALRLLPMLRWHMLLMKSS